MAGSTNWEEKARCRGAGLEMVPDETTGPAIVPQKRLCVSCPVRQECLAHALDTYTGHRRLLHGIWGGHTVDDRRRLAHGMTEQSCTSCWTYFAGKPGADTCDSCSHGQMMQRVEAHADQLRDLINRQSHTVTSAAATLGLPYHTTALWAAANIKVRRRGMSIGGHALAPCGTATARKRHRRDRAAKGLSTDLSDLTCGCAPRPRKAARPDRQPCGTRAARAKHLEQMRAEGKPEDLTQLSCACALKPCGTEAAKRRHLKELKLAGKPQTLYGLTCACAPRRSPARNSTVTVEKVA